MSNIDLHIHTNISGDGEFSPSEILTQAKSLHMERISITDHNSVRGIPEALQEADGIQVLPGIELDCVYAGKNFHLLGYCFDYSRLEYENIEQAILNQEKQTAEEKIRLFQKASGIPIRVSDVIDAACDGIVTGELIAEILLNREDAWTYEVLRPYLPGGPKSDMPNVRFYWDYFSEGKAAYVPIHYMALSDAVSLIHNTGGRAVLAHPGQNLSEDDSLLAGIISEKIDGIEAFSSYHSVKTALHYYEMARQKDLLATCGSDFHGKHKPQIPLGGHGAILHDSELLSGLNERLLVQA